MNEEEKMLKNGAYNKIISNIKKKQESFLSKFETELKDTLYFFSELREQVEITSENEESNVYTGDIDKLDNKINSIMEKYISSNKVKYKIFYKQFKYHSWCPIENLKNDKHLYGVLVEICVDIDI